MIREALAETPPLVLVLFALVILGSALLVASVWTERLWLRHVGVGLWAGGVVGLLVSAVVVLW